MLIAVRRSDFDFGQGFQDQRQKSPQVGEDQADVVACAAKDCVKGVAHGAFEGASGQASIGFHVAYGGFDGGPSAEFAFERKRHRAALAGDVDGGAFGAVATIASVDKGAVGPCVGEDLDLLERFAEGVAVVRVA